MGEKWPLPRGTRETRCKPHGHRNPCAECVAAAERADRRVAVALILALCIGLAAVVFGVFAAGRR
jgi:hypothetical protein